MPQLPGVVAFLQFIALISTFWIIVRNGRHQLRAYVLPHDAGLYEGTMLTPPAPAHTNEPGVVLNFRNSGQTPAYDVVSWAQIEVITPTKENNLIVPSLKPVFSNFIAANGVMPKSLWFGRSLTANEIAAIGTGALVIYLHGRIEYKDAFKKKRFTNFRFAYAGLFPPPQGVIFTVCQKGNEAK